MLGKVPAWVLYATIVALIYFNATRLSKDVGIPPPSPELGPLLPSESPNDDQIITHIGSPASGIGTAFAIDGNGTWLTARHVVDGCDQVALKIANNRIIRAKYTAVEKNDLALLKTDWSRRPLPSDVDSRRQIGEMGYFIGFPQGEPSEVVGSLISRSRMYVRGRYTSQESVLAWAEIGRTLGLRGSLGGLSGAPVLDEDGEIIGVVTAENPRRGRIYSVAPKALRPFFSDVSGQAEPLDRNSYGIHADKLRRARRVAQVLCLVDDQS